MTKNFIYNSIDKLFYRIEVINLKLFAFNTSLVLLCRYKLAVCIDDKIKIVPEMLLV